MKALFTFGQDVIGCGIVGLKRKEIFHCGRMTQGAALRAMLLSEAQSFQAQLDSQLRQTVRPCRGRVL